MSNSSARPSLRLLYALFAGVALLLLAGHAVALPAEAYQVEFFSLPGKTYTSVRGVDAAGRVLGYWTVYNQQPQPIGAPPDEEGYVLWQNGVSAPFAIPGLTNMNVHRMNIAGAMWGSSDEGSFVYRNGALSIVQSDATDVTLIQGVDAAGRVYGLLGNYPPGVDPDDVLVPINPVSSFVWEAGTFSDLNLLLEDASLVGVRQDGVLWGSNGDASFIQSGLSLTVVDHPGYDHTGLHMLTADGDALGFGLTITEETFDSETFFWDPVGGFQTWPDGQNLPGTSVRSTAVNEQGIFWGFAGTNLSFVAKPVPEPSTALLLSLGLVGLVLRRNAPPGRKTSPLS